MVPLNLNTLPNLSNPLSILELLYASSFPLLANAFAPAPTPYTNGVSNIDSEPNFNLLANFLDASSAGSSEISLSNSVGPPSNKSPNVPIFSTSATSVSPTAPPATIAANLCLPDKSFNCFTLAVPFLRFLALKFAYFPALFAFKALAAMVAAFAPAPPGIPI